MRRTTATACRAFRPVRRSALHSKRPASHSVPSASPPGAGSHPCRLLVRALDSCPSRTRQASEALQRPPAAFRTLHLHRCSNATHSLHEVLQSSLQTASARRTPPRPSRAVAAVAGPGRARTQASALHLLVSLFPCAQPQHRLAACTSTPPPQTRPSTAAARDSSQRARLRPRRISAPSINPQGKSAPSHVKLPSPSRRPRPVFA